MSAPRPPITELRWRIRPARQRVSGANITGSGLLNLSGGTLSTGAADVGYDSTGVVTQSGGTFTTNGPRNNIYNPGQYQWDIALFKNVNVGGTKSAQFRAEIFNLFNRDNFASPVGTPCGACSWARPRP